MSDTRFLVFSAGFNSEKWVRKNILSVKKQKYKNYVHVIVDDATTDRTKRFIELLNHDKLEVHRNEKNLRWIHNAIKYIDLHTKSDEDVIVVVDLDDWLASPYVLQTLHETYTKYKCWITCGGYASFIGNKITGVKNLNQSLENRRIRDQGCFTHLKTFKSFLWNNINKDDLRGADGRYVKCTYDRAIMYPMAEMTPIDKIQFVNELSYIYNQSNPLSICNIENKNQKTNKKWFNKKKSYEKLYRK